jgi:glycerol-3-phosphate acyltransferase PlsY
LLLFDRTAAAVALLLLALGDPVAALAGRAAPGPRLWGKSPVGTLAFLAAGLAGAGAWVIWTGLPLHWSLVAAAVVAAVVEFLPLPVDDNLSVPLAAGVTLWLMGTG